MSNKIYTRFFVYILIWQLYLSFMSVHAPLGTDWLSWHFQRIYNFSEYLKINGYLSSFGFSIWSKCEGCSLDFENWIEKIYLSINFFSFFPHIIINDFFGSDNLKLYGHLVDKSTIFLSGCLISELLIKLYKKKRNKFYNFILPILCFTFFIINPWTYKMIIAGWWLIYFLLFFLLGILMFLNKKNKLGFFCFFLAGCFDYQSSVGMAFFYIFVLLILFLKNKINFNNEFFPNSQNKLSNYIIIISLMLPVFIFFFLRMGASSGIENPSGSFLLMRIGISGDDTYNGGILGALQFLGGNRITQCFINFEKQINLDNLSDTIFIYNCALSLLSMVIVSLISIIGLFFLHKKNNVFFKIVALPILFLFLSYTFLLQQSSSAHLMGYSYFFSVLFSVGITTIIFKILEKYNFSLISIFLATPITLGVISLCIRVSMLTGVNG
jgi:hypothetical protein